MKANKHPPSRPDLADEAAELRAQLAECQTRLAEAEETLEAIRTGAVDALVVSGPAGDRVFSLESAETPYRALVEEINEGALLLRPDGNILYANTRFAELAGTPLEQIIGSSCHRLFPPADHSRLDALLQAARHGGLRQEFALEARPDAAPRAVEISLSLLKGTQAETFSAIVTDITARKKAQESIQNLNKELKERATLLEATNQELEAFCYSVSHDLRAPLRGIDGFSHALLEDYEGKLDAQGVDFLQRIRRACQRMAQLIDDLLNLSRISRSKMHWRRVDLSKLAREVASELREIAPERVVQFHIAEGINSEGDQGLLRVVLWNLLANAWKFTGKSAEAVIEFGARRQDGDEVYFVRDNGPGFDMAYADTLFKPFQRLHPMTEFPGSGIGLATVGRVVHRHGGRVWAEAAPGQGATFFFTLGHEEGQHGQQ